MRRSFTSRVVFVVDDNRKRSIAWPKKREGEHLGKVRDRFESTITTARGVGPIGITKGGLKRFTNWYNTRASHTDPFRSGFEAREDDHLLRIAGCLAINDGTGEIQSRHIGYGSKLISQVKDGSFRLFGGDFSYHAKLVSAIERVRDVLLAAGSDGVMHSDLQNKVQRSLDAQELKTLTTIMHECGMIQIFKVKKGRSTATYYRATRAIEKFGVSSEILAKLNLPA